MGWKWIEMLAYKASNWARSITDKPKISADVNLIVHLVYVKYTFYADITRFHSLCGALHRSDSVPHPRSWQCGYHVMPCIMMCSYYGNKYTGNRWLSLCPFLAWIKRKSVFVKVESVGRRAVFARMKSVAVSYARWQLGLPALYQGRQRRNPVTCLSSHPCYVMLEVVTALES
jgi:hypothetical protein